MWKSVSATLLFVLAVHFSYGGVLHKCCPSGQRLRFTVRNEEVLECELIGPETNTTDWWWWFPKHVMLAANSTTAEGATSEVNLNSNVTLNTFNETKEIRTLEKQIIAYGSKPKCPSSSKDILFQIKKSRHEFNFIVVDNEIRLEVLKGASLHDKKVGHSEYFSSDSYCVDAGPKQVPNMFVVYLCPCSTIRCVRKCCDEEEVYDEREGNCKRIVKKKNLDIFNWLPELRKDPDGELEYYRLVKKTPVCPHTITVVNDNRTFPNFYLLQDKSIQVTETGTIFPSNEICIDYTSKMEEMVHFCLKMDLATVILHKLYGVIFVIGALALLLTVVLTVIFPEMRRNIYNKMALAHNVMLLVGYVTTGTSQLVGATFPIIMCKYMSFISQFSILVAVFTLNVMCIDISLVFSDMRPYHGVVKKGRKKCFFYSLYAFGSTAVICIITAIVEFTPGIASSLRPNFGADVLCFFNGRTATWLFFYGPMTVLYCINLALFFFTAAKIFAVKRDTAILHSMDSGGSAKNKQKMVLYVNLFIMMSLDITWVIEVISFTYSDTWPSYLWHICDVIFLLRGVFIFVIFCWKKTVYVLVRDRLRRVFGKMKANLSSSIGDTKTTGTGTGNSSKNTSLQNTVSS